MAVASAPRYCGEVLGDPSLPETCVEALLGNSNSNQADTFQNYFFFFQCLFIGSLLGGMFGDPHPYLEDGRFVPLPGCSGTVKQDCEGFLLFFVQTLLCRVSVGGFQLWLLWENGLNHE